MRGPIERRIYTEKIKGFIDTEQVKIIMGIRRCGKSEILKLVRQEVLRRTDEDHVIFINFEAAESDHIVSYKELNDYIANKMKDELRYYIFFDEIQMVENWEKSVNALRLKNTDIYITGSNSKLLSGELSTLLAGRYLAFGINTLSFSEFINFRRIRKTRSEMRLDDQDDAEDDVAVPLDLDNELDDYIKLGGFPFLSTKQFTFEQARQIITDIQSSIVLKDVVARNKVKNIPLLERVLFFIYDNVGNLVSIKRITDFLKNSGTGADFETISNYLGYLEAAFIIRKVPRFDIKTKRILESNDKYYLADHSLQYATKDMGRMNLPGILENIVHNELRRRGYKVYAGRISKDDNREIDIVAERASSGDKVYVQICTEFNSAELMDKKFSPLIDIKDHYPKYVVTLDRYWRENRNGVLGIHLKDFLLKDAY